MFINLTARKPNGDFIITSSEVEMEKYRGALNEWNIRAWMFDKARDYFIKGYNVELTQEAE